jgi:hypothetical protein
MLSLDSCEFRKEFAESIDVDNVRGKTKPSSSTVVPSTKLPLPDGLMTTKPVTTFTVFDGREGHAAQCGCCCSNSGLERTNRILTVNMNTLT